MSSPEKKEEFAAALLKLAADTIIVNMRFMDTAVSRLFLKSSPGLGRTAVDGDNLLYDPDYILSEYLHDENLPVRILLHSLLHCIFFHSFGYEKLDESLWDLSCDIAVENLIMELNVPGFSLAQDDEMQIRLKGLKKYSQGMTAERIYKYYLAQPPADSSALELKRLFCRDIHSFWKSPQALEMTENQWKKISERIRTELKAFSGGAGASESLIKNLDEAARDRYDYKSLLERFCSRGEELRICDDEFDSIYYTYGLTHYDRMPLIEPLEYADEKRIRDFAIVLDTSASCRGDVVRSFLQKTYDIMKNTESFSSRINLHLIQCDSEVRSDTLIRTRGDFDSFIKSGRLLGFGGTDFRPAFEYVDSLVESGEFTDLKGLIYFTDGYGIYPSNAPDYDCIFAFVSREDNRPEVPWWAVPIVIDDEV